MHPSFDTTLNDHLDHGERLLWSGQPRGGVRLCMEDVFLIPFSILWCGFVIFWEASAIGGGAPIFFMVWGVPFILVGLYLVVGRFFVDALSRSHTFYGVTDERILIAGGIFMRQIKSLQLRTLTDLSLTERGDGSGTIKFGPTNALNAFFPASSWPGAGRFAQPSFDLIESAKEVYEIIRKAQKQSD
jgi:hypothetical protein